MEENTIQTKQWLDKCYPDSALSKQMVEKWFAEKRRAHTNPDDAEHWLPKFGSCSRKHKKSPQNGFGQS